jgi:sugar fermentation stimulation protein A
LILVPVSRDPRPKLAYRFSTPLKTGKVVSRPNRFVMMVSSRGKTLRCHCPTTGRLGDLDLSGIPCLYSTSLSRTRKTAHTVEAISISQGETFWIGINQTAANRYLEFFLRNGSLSKMARGKIVREVRLGRSRIDFKVGRTFLEVKTPLITLPSSSAARKVKHSRFDSFDRLIRHMNELRGALADGGRAIIALCYLYDAEPFVPPSPDTTNRRILEAAQGAELAGVERWQVNLKVDKEGVSLIRYFRSRPYTHPTH